MYAHQLHNKSGQTCPFCRADIMPITDEEWMKMMEKRAAANNDVATFQLGHMHHRGDLGVKKDLGKAVELHVRAAELGSALAYRN